MAAGKSQSILLGDFTNMGLPGSENPGLLLRRSRGGRPDLADFACLFAATRAMNVTTQSSGQGENQ